MYGSVIKHDVHLRTRGKYRKHEPMFSSFLKCSQKSAGNVSSQCNTRLSRLHFKTRFFYVLYCDKTLVFDQSERTLGSIL